MRVPATNVEVYIKEKLILLLSYLELFLKVFFNVLEENYVREIKNNCLVYATAIFNLYFPPQLLHQVQVKHNVLLGLGLSWEWICRDSKTFRQCQDSGLLRKVLLYILY